jgi:hypothetical protein
LGQKETVLFLQMGMDRQTADLPGRQKQQAPGHQLLIRAPALQSAHGDCILIA